MKKLNQPYKEDGKIFVDVIECTRLSKNKVAIAQFKKEFIPDKSGIFEYEHEYELIARLSERVKNGKEIPITEPFRE